MKNTAKGFITFPLLILAVILLIGGGVLVYMQRDKQVGQTTSSSQQSVPIDSFQNLSKEQQQMLELGRSRARDALIQSDLTGVQTQAKINYNDIGTYADFCANAFVVKTLTHIQTAVGAVPTCNASSAAFAASSPLFVDSTKSWCVDSTGFNSKTTIPLGTNTVCQQ